MGEIAKIKVNGNLESSYKIFSKNREFEKRAECHPDWNQNDDTQPDYVKNRPFYGDVAETVLLEESILSFTNPEGGYYYAAIPTTIELTAGETYKVSWDGATYECVCESIMGGPAIGNPSIMYAGADTGDPFLITPLNYDNGTDFYTIDASASHTISISGFIDEIVKIDKKYLPVASETEPGIISVNSLSNVILQQVVISSSTAGSTKKFKITVDDSGTLTTTEVT